MAYDLAIVGAGPGGYVAAIRAAQLGMKVVLVERDRIGGTCLNVGCIPTKALMSSAHLLFLAAKAETFGVKIAGAEPNWEGIKSFMSRTVDQLVSGVEKLLKANGVEIIREEARLEEGKLVAGGQPIEARNVIIATGSRPASLPGVDFDGERIVDSTGLLFGASVPESLVVVGAGAVGLELALAFRLLGSRVVVVEMMDTVLPGIDRDMASLLERTLKRKGLQILTSTRVLSVEKGRDGVAVKVEGKSGQQVLEGERVLVAAGRRPNSEPFSSLQLDSKGFIKVDSQLRTSQRGIYAIGDVTGGKLLAHRASHQAIWLVEKLAGKEEKSPEVVPFAVFTIPEFASAGLTEREAKERGIAFRKARFPLTANGRALSMDETEGAVKVITDQEGRLIGVHILAPAASELTGEAALAVEKGVKASELASLIHVHPTVSEALMEAAAAVEKKAIHIFVKP